MGMERLEMGYIPPLPPAPDPSCELQTPRSNTDMAAGPQTILHHRRNQLMTLPEGWELFHVKDSDVKMSVAPDEGRRLIDVYEKTLREM